MTAVVGGAVGDSVELNVGITVGGLSSELRHVVGDDHGVSLSVSASVVGEASMTGLASTVRRT